MKTHIGIYSLITLFAAAFAGMLSGCSKPEYSNVIDTVSCPVTTAARASDIGSAYFKKKVVDKTKRFQTMDELRGALEKFM